MNERTPFGPYRGRGVVNPEGAPAPPSEEISGWDDPANYRASPGLRDGVNVALLLGHPLLVTGAPGTGKTHLAGSVAHELRLTGPFVFNTKTTSSAGDLFYRYDSLRHFHDSQFYKESRPPETYVTFEALGLAIVLSLSPDDPRRRVVNDCLPKRLRGLGPVRSVVLIDEIDKAPRDLPNDVLNEIKEMSFEVKEMRGAEPFRAEPPYRPVLILTSNSEKNLPDAFLRRCVFHHIEFPEREELKGIVEARLGLDGRMAAMLDGALAHFEEIRDLALRKKPATAELLEWLHVLRSLGLLEKVGAGVESLGPGEAEALALTYAVLAKNKEDLESLRENLGRET